MTLENELVAKFGKPAGEPAVASALESLMKIHSLDVEELYIKWEQFAYHQNEQSTALNADMINAFKQFLQQQIEKKASMAGGPGSAASSLKKPKTLRPNVSSPSLFGFGAPKTPTLKKRRVDQTPTQSNIEGDTISLASPTEKKEASTMLPSVRLAAGESPVTPSLLANNPDPGKVVDVFNLADIEVSEGLNLDGEKLVKPIPFYDSEKYKFRTMRQNLLDVADVLDEQIEIFTKVFQDHYKTTASDPTIQSQSEITAVGRIVPDSPAADGMLNTESLALETSRLTGIGRRIPLNLERTKEVSLFPGQIVGVRGKNASGDYFVVEEFLQIPHLNSPVSTEGELQSFNEDLDGKSMKVVVTNGPYTASNCLDFGNLEDFVERLNDGVKPHVVIMFGPFLDVTHPLLASGRIPEFPGVKVQPKTLDEVFTKIISPILRKINSKIQVVLVPSTTDTASNHAAYPQDCFDRKQLQLPKNFKCFTNPSTFQLNELFVGCSNVDAFKDIKEVVKGGATCSKNRFDRIAEHILSQRRFYPLFPGALKRRKLRLEDGHDVWEHVSGADLEVSYLGLTEFVANLLPDLVIIPSELSYFTRVVQNVLFINPGMFIRPTGLRGTFAQLSILPPDLADGRLTKVEGDEMVYLHNLWKRCRVDIVTA